MSAKAMSFKDSDRSRLSTVLCSNENKLLWRGETNQALVPREVVDVREDMIQILSQSCQYYTVALQVRIHTVVMGYEAGQVERSPLDRRRLLYVRLRSPSLMKEQASLGRHRTRLKSMFSC